MLRPILLILLAGSVAAINGCEGWGEKQNLAKGTLRVVALREPLSRIRPGEGLESDLLWHFGQNAGLKLSWTWAESPEEALRMLEQGQAEVAAGRWSAEGFPDSSPLSASPAYEESSAVLVCPKQFRSEVENSFLQNWFLRDELERKTKVEGQPLRIGAHRRDLTPDLQRELTHVGPLWQIRAYNSSALVLARQVTEKKVDCFVTDATTGRWLQALRPWLRVTRDLDSNFSKTFLFAPGRHDLEVAFTSWFQTQNRLGQLTPIRNRYFGFQQSLGDSDRVRLLKARLTKLPTLSGKFRKYAAEFDLPWPLLAAVAYQESHWDNDAESHTGVRGIMQLTRDTANDLGVTDRENIDESLWGGAKYLRSLIDQQPAHLHPRDRLALALAAYNVGIGHLRDAQHLAIAAGVSPFSFWDLRSFLPKLSDPMIAAELEFGSARGDEPVQFTERVLAFYELLSDRSDVL